TSTELGHSRYADGRSCNPQRNKKAPALKGGRGWRSTRLAVPASRPGLLRGTLADLDALGPARGAGLGFATHSGLAAESTERRHARRLSRPCHRTRPERGGRLGGRRSCGAGRRGRRANGGLGGGFRRSCLGGCGLPLGRGASLRRRALGGRLLGTGPLRRALLCRAALGRRLLAAGPLCRRSPGGRLLLMRGFLLRWHFSSLGCVTQSSRLVPADGDLAPLPA